MHFTPPTRAEREDTWLNPRRVCDFGHAMQGDSCPECEKIIRECEEALQDPKTAATILLSASERAVNEKANRLAENHL